MALWIVKVGYQGHGEFTLNSDGSCILNRTFTTKKNIFLKEIRIEHLLCFYYTFLGGTLLGLHVNSASFFSRLFFL